MNSSWRKVTPQLLRAEEAHRTGLFVFIAITVAYIMGRYKLSYLLLPALSMVLWTYLNRRLDKHWHYFHTRLTLDKPKREHVTVLEPSIPTGDSRDPFEPENAPSPMDASISDLQKIRSLTPADSSCSESSDAHASLGEAEVDEIPHVDVATKEIGIANSYFALAWPQISLFLEEKLSTAINDAFSARGKQGKGAELLYARFEEGGFKCLDVRGHVRGWTEANGSEDDFIVEARIIFQGKLRIGAKLTFFLGASVRSSIEVRSLSFTMRFSFQERTQKPPFVKFCRAEVIDDPILEFGMFLGSFDPAKIPSAEHWIRQKLVDKIKTTTFTVAFKSSDATASPSSSGLLKVFVDCLERHDEGVGLYEDQKSGTYALLPSNEAKEEPQLESSYSVTLNLGKVDKTSANSSTGIFRETFIFFLDIGDLKEAGKLKIKAVENIILDKSRGRRQKKTAKGMLELLEVFGSSLQESLVQNVSYQMLPLGFGQLRLRLLWEPLRSPASFSHSLAIQGLSSWSLSEPFGVLGIRVSHLDVSFPLAPNAAAYCMIRFGDPSAHPDSLQVFRTKACGSSRVWDEEQDLLCFGESDELWIALVDGYNRDHVLSRTKVKLWDFLKEQKSLSCFMSVELEAEDGSFHKLLIALSFKPTTYFLDSAKRWAFLSSTLPEPETHNEDSSNLLLSDSTDHEDEIKISNLKVPVYRANRKKSDVKESLEGASVSAKYSVPKIEEEDSKDQLRRSASDSQLTHSEDEDIISNKKAQRPSFMSKFAGLFTKVDSNKPPYNTETFKEMSEVSSKPILSLDPIDD